MSYRPSKFVHDSHNCVDLASGQDPAAGFGRLLFARFGWVWSTAFALRTSGGSSYVGQLYDGWSELWVT